MDFGETGNEFQKQGFKYEERKHGRKVGKVGKVGRLKGGKVEPMRKEGKAGNRVKVGAVGKPGKDV